MTRYIGSWQTPSIKLPEATDTSAPGVWKLDEHFMLQKWGRWPTNIENEDITSFSYANRASQDLNGNGYGAVFTSDNQYVLVSGIAHGIYTDDPMYGSYKDITLLKRISDNYMRQAIPATGVYTGNIDHLTKNDSYFVKRGLGTLYSISVWTLDKNEGVITKLGPDLLDTGGMSSSSSIMNQVEHLAVTRGSSILIYSRSGTTYTLLNTITFTTSSKLLCRYISNDTKLAVFNYDGSLQIYSISGSNYVLESVQSIPHNSDIFNISLEREGNYFIVEYENSPYMRIYNITSGTLQEMSLPSDFVRNPGNSAISQNGNILASCPYNYDKVNLFSKNGNTYSKLEGNIDIDFVVTSNSLSISNDGTKLYLGSPNFPRGKFYDIAYS